MMKIILLERVQKLGTIGDVVKVKPGYARNFLLPQKKAAVATKNNIAYFESQKSVLLAANDKQRAEAEALAAKINGTELTLIRQAGEAGQLFGSVTSRDIATALNDKGFTVDRKHVEIGQPIKNLGIATVVIAFHADVQAKVLVSVAKTEDEAKAQLIAAKNPPKKSKKEEADVAVEEVVAEEETAA